MKFSCEFLAVGQQPLMISYNDTPMVNNFILYWIPFHGLVLAFGFGLGLAVGVKIPVIGDTVAMLLVGGLLMVMQYILLNDQFGITKDWIKYSFAGLILGVGVAFIFILIFDKGMGLEKSHIWGLPIALGLLALIQALVFRKAGVKHVDNYFVWPLISLLALGLAAIILILVNSRYDLAFNLLADRHLDIPQKIQKWALTGFIIGIVYGVITGLLLNASK